MQCELEAPLCARRRVVCLCGRKLAQQSVVGNVDGSVVLYFKGSLLNISFFVCALVRGVVVDMSVQAADVRK